jgi:serine/threonine-protein kinase
VPNLFYPYAGTLEPGRITLNEPAPVVPEMVSMKLDVHGRLLELHAVPPLKTPKGAAPATNWTPLFEAAKLQQSEFDAVAPVEAPPSFATERMAWIPKNRGAFDPPFRVEAASFHGRPVYFQMIYEWTSRREQSVGSEGTLDYAAKVVLALFFTGILLAAAALAPRNLYRGRADRQGAMRLAFWTFVILMFVWLVETHHIVDIQDELRLLTSGLAFALSWAGLLWLTYIALEPYVRQLWPESLITWTRFLAGQWRDPRVGRDVLLGVLVGVLFQLFDQVGRTLPALFGLTTAVPYFDWWIPNTLVRGYWIGNFVINVVYCFRWAFFDKLLVFLMFRVVLRHPLSAAVIFVLYSTAVWVGNSVGFHASSASYWLFGVLLQALAVCLLIRVGVLAVITAYFVWYTVCFPLTTDLTAWNVQSMHLALGTVLLLAGYGFYISLAGRSLFSDSARDQG